MIACEGLCIPFDGNKMVDREEPFLGFFQLLQLNNGVWTQMGHFDFLNIISANFQQDS